MDEYKLGYKKIKGRYSKREFIFPSFDKNGEFLEETDIKYPMIKIFLDLKDFFKNKKISLFLRKCEEIAIKEILKEKQIEDRNLKIISIPCSENLIEECECKYYGKERKTNFPEDYNFWGKEFLRCIKCMGCVENCPVCFCERCTLLDEFYVKKGEIPPEYPIFHFIKAFHMAGRCVECNLCFESCPAVIPVNYLARRMNEFVKREFGYEPGGEEINPLFKRP